MSRFHTIVRKWLRDPSAVYLCAASTLIGIVWTLPAHPLRALAIGEAFALWLWIRQFDSPQQPVRANSPTSRRSSAAAGVIQVPALW
jgi:hypothetical protein